MLCPQCASAIGPSMRRNVSSIQWPNDTFVTQHCVAFRSFSKTRSLKWRHLGVIRFISTA